MTLAVVSVGPCMSASAGPWMVPSAGFLWGSAKPPSGVFGSLSAPSTCGIPPGVAGVDGGVSLPGDSHTFLFLLDLASRLVAGVTAAARAAGVVAGSAGCGWGVLSAAAPIRCDKLLLLAVACCCCCCCRSQAGLFPWGCCSCRAVVTLRRHSLLL